MDKTKLFLIISSMILLGLAVYLHSIDHITIELKPLPWDVIGGIFLRTDVCRVYVPPP